MDPTTEHSSIVEAFLLIEQPRQRLGHWTKALAALDEQGAPPPVEIIAYYDPTCDQALVDLQYLRARANMRFVMEVALLAEVGMVQPAELSDGERTRFLAERLTRCTIRVTGQATAAAALGELVRKIKDVRANKTGHEPPPIPLAARGVEPRGDTQDPVMLVQAKGTREDLENLEALENRARMTGDPFAPQPDRETTTFERPQRDDATRAREHFRSVDRHRTAEMPAELTQRLIGESSQMMRLRDLKPTSRIEGNAQQSLLSDFERAPQVKGTPPPPLPGRAEDRTDPYLPTPSAAQLANVIHARYLRSGRWVPVRVGALSLKGAALLAGALPRVEDRIEVAFSFGTYRALVRGTVQKTSTTREATATGTSTFTVAFDLDATARRALTNLLTAARDAKITIKPPPQRATRRFSVEWQVALGTVRGAVKATAHDVSMNGMFVQTQLSLEVGSTVTFSVVLDDTAAAIAGRAKVVRELRATEAQNCGLVAGYGLFVVSMSEADRMRWLGFLARIERRADKRVLIGADPVRFAELQASLASLGYAVAGGTDPGALVQLANADTRPADAVLIDAGWLRNEASASLVENIFSARNVPCVTMQGEGRRARVAIDKLLDVAV